MYRSRRRRAIIAAAMLALAGFAGRAVAAGNDLLAETVEFTGAVLFLETGVPGLVIGAVRGGETAVSGFGEFQPGSGQAPDGDTLMRVGSVSKAFTGAVLASMAADGTVGLSDALSQHLDWQLPRAGGRPIRLIDMATHSSGLPRELDREPGPEENPFATLTADAYRAALTGDPQLFAAGTGALYSNFGFDMLALGLADAAGKSYEALLSERVLEPMGLADTGFSVAQADRARLMQGHGFDGAPLPDVSNSPAMSGASGLYSTANDMLKWLQWHLDRSPSRDDEMRLLNHAAYLQRDGLDPVYALDESGHMDAMGLGWVIMRPQGDRPLIMQKAGGLQGMFVYHAFAPARGVGVFVAINKFDFAASAAMAAFANDLIGQLAPR